MRFALALLTLCAAPIGARADGTLERLSIVTASGPHAFQVEVMRNDEDRERGLMYRRFLPADRGMLFDFKTAQPVMMWMKNTYIPLDMVFIGPDGRVVSTAQNAEPLGVLEVNAGTVAKIGVQPGDRVEHALFPK